MEEFYFAVHQNFSQQKKKKGGGWVEITLMEIATHSYRPHISVLLGFKLTEAEANSWATPVYSRHIPGARTGQLHTQHLIQ